MATKKNTASKVTNKGKRAVANATVVKDDLEVKNKPIELPSAPVAKKIVDSKTPEKIKQEVDELLELLQSSTNKNEKKKIRRALRTRGHRGGLNGQKSAIQIARAKSVNADADDDDDEDDDD